MSNTKITEPEKQPPANFVHRDLTDEILHILNTYADFIDEAIDFGCKILFWEPKEDHDGSPVSPMSSWVAGILRLPRYTPKNGRRQTGYNSSFRSIHDELMKTCD